MARKRSNWQMVASMESIYLNRTRSNKSDIITPDELNPFVKQKPKNMITGKVAWDILKKAFSNKE